MSTYINDIRELVGNTPLLKINNFGLPRGINLFAKLEYYNPAGSVKDRIGLAMLAAAEASGRLKAGGSIVEATAGNTGLGVALAAIGKGYRVILVVPEKFSAEKQVLMEALGAEVIRSPGRDGMQGAAWVAAELLKQIPGAITLAQFDNPANPNIHYLTTAPEIVTSLNGQIDYFVAGAGSGGTFHGVAKYLREQARPIINVLADPEGSTMGGGSCGSYQIEGIGNDFIPATMDMKLVDRVIKVNDQEAFYYAQQLARREGVLVGSSAGAAMAAAVKLAHEIDQPASIVTIFPDRGDRYFSKQLYTAQTEPNSENEPLLLAV